MQKKLWYNDPHMDETEVVPELPKIKNVGIIAGGISIALILLIILQHNLAFQKTSQTIIPAGNTYLGPSKSDPTPQATATPEPTTVVMDQPKNTSGKEINMNTQGKLSVSSSAKWSVFKGKKYPYSFSAPSALKLVTLASDTYDIYAISWENRPADQNVLVGVDDLSRTTALKQYVTMSKRSYVETWWKQFGGLKGVGSIVEFTNSKGLKGYRAKYLNSSNQTPNDDVFFETPDTKYVIHLASGILDTAFFNALIDSVAWTK